MSELEHAKLDHLRPTDLPARLAAQLEEKLPADHARRRFAPQLAYGRHQGPAPAGARKAAVAILLFPQDDEWFLPITLRPPQMTRHANQLSLPGGAVDAGESDFQCALRELQEELAVDRHDVHLIGPLSPLYVFASNFAVTPWLLHTVRRPAFHPDRKEVAEMIEVPLRALCSPENCGQHTIRRGALQFSAPHIEYAGHLIWGATCMILGELLALFERVERL